MQHINRFRELGDVNDAKPTIIKIDSDFLPSRTERVEWLPVIWVKPGLNLAKLVSSLLASIKAEDVVILDVSQRNNTHLIRHQLPLRQQVVNDRRVAVAQRRQVCTLEHEVLRHVGAGALEGDGGVAAAGRTG